MRAIARALVARSWPDDRGCGASVAGLGCILLAERSAGPVPATAPADAPAATTAAMAPGDRGRIGSPPPAEALPADRLRHAA